ncbi:BHLH family transcription factor [Stagonosporopsis vannaccii]|nr:BHLH family transcription factor [Stagonosporopsis vannaccii]
MSDKDPPPFGYTFSSDFFHGSSTPLDTHGQSLLSDMEGQSLADFFSNTDPFSLSDAQPFGAPADTKLAGNDFSDWNFMAPATVHQVSATIPDQAQLHHGFPGDSMFATQPLQLDHMATTHDDLQAASTLFNNSQQPAYLANRSHSFHDMSSSSSNHNAHNTHHPHHHSMSSHTHNGRPMVATSQGLLNEQLAALLPNHAAAGTLDAQLAAQWAGSDAHHRVQEEFGLHRPSLKRTYTFGTDNSFSNPTGFTAPHNETEDQITRRLMRDMEHSQAFIPTIQHTTDTKPLAPASPTSSDSTSSPSSGDEDQPTKKRKKSTQIKKEVIRKTAPGGRVSKSKKPSEADSKKKRVSAAAQKLQRENLSEEQKRNNHILSEQKRRNLIKRGFDDLHDLVPEIRNGGLSKSSVLMEAANFLDKLIQDNNELARLVSGKAS